MNSEQIRQQSVAIVGIACRLPGQAANMDKLWELLYEGRATWSPVPETRFHEQAFFDPDSKRNGAFHTRGGHFLQDDISRFDAPFFNINPAEAKAMDPQMRLLLESAYEAFENSGMTLDLLRGTDTAAYVALYNRDYEKMLLRDSEDLPFYYQTGNGEAMYANRLSYFFDLHGPSSTLDTGCSGGMVALHQACESIRHGESTQAIVGASNLILDPASMIGPSFLQFYSSDGRSKAFDQCADGYGRGEGVCTLVLKRLSTAIADGDPIRAVIKSSVMNQDGRTTGITVPSGEAQESLIHAAYVAAGLDPADTSYVEAHGAGTAVGDLTESQSVGSVIGNARKTKGREPVVIGSIKANIGHLENVSGLAAVIKAVLVIEKGCIPKAVKFQQPSREIQWKSWNLDLPTQLRSLDSSQVSLNSFGYGGTNVHVILDKFHESEEINDSITDGSRSLVFALSARSSSSAYLAAEILQKYLDKIHLDRENDSIFHSLAHTLSTRRSIFPWRAAVVASSVSQLHERLGSLTYLHNKKMPKIGFVFTGQGAQWATMGSELWEINAVFRNSIAAAEKCLTDLGVNWKLTDELWKSPDQSRLNSAILAQPACTAIQLALVDLLAAWNIYPSAVTGHSSGEIAAAYACKAISFRDAILVAYARGCVAGQIAEDKRFNGAMIAVGLGPQAVESYLHASSESDGLVTIACINSPEAVTVSGDKVAVDILEAKLHHDGVFARRLPVDVAYHSYHMLRVADMYRDALATMKAPHSNPDVPFYSSVTGTALDGTKLGPQYWVQNLVSPVLFSPAMDKLLSSEAPQMIVEIGPHAALKGPIKQIFKVKAKKILYLSTMVRHQRTSQCLTELASHLFTHGAHVNLDKANLMSGSTRHRVCLTDLPPYPWDHSSSFWHESRLNKNYRHRADPAHELLGILSPESSWMEPRWRNYISLSSHSWLAGHRIHDKVIFPAAGFMAMAMEAAYKMATQQLSQHKRIGNIELSDVSICESLIIPNSGSIELIFVLRPASDLRGRDLARRHEFVISSCSDKRNVVEHCRGFVKIDLDDTEPPLGLLEHQIDIETLPQVRIERWYDDLKRIGIEYTDQFRGLVTASAGRGYSSSTLRPHATLGKYSVGLHPATLDLCLQTMLAAIGSTDAIRSPILPTYIQGASVRVDCLKNAYSRMRVSSKVKKLDGNKFYADIEGCSFDADQTGLVMSLRGLQAVSLKSVPKKMDETDQVKACQKMVMMLDPDHLNDRMVDEICNASLSPVSVASMLAQFRDVCRYYAQAAVKEISHEDVQRMTPYQIQYLTWLQREAKLGAYDVSASLVDQVNSLNAEGEMICRVGSGLPSILKGLQEPLSLMMKDNLLYRLYEDDQSMQRSATQAGEFARMLGLKSPGLRILEIGGGTGCATLPILEALSRSERDLFSHYRFTDVSSGFFANAHKKLEQWKELIQYQKLDIEQDPAQQGFQPSDYDLVVAANVLHATTNIEKTVQHVRQLLKEGGKLLLLESTRPTVHRSFIFGSLPGWWLGATQRNKGGPLLSEQEWNETLLGQRLSGVDAILHSYPAPEDQSDSLIISTACPDGPPYIDGAQLALTLTQEQLSKTEKSLGYRVAQRLSTLMISRAVEIHPLGDNGLQDRTCILLTDLDGSIIGDLDPAKLQDLKHTLKLAREVIWVTCGAMDQCMNPMSSLVWGLARVLRHENPHVPIITLDLDPEDLPQSQEMTTTLRNFIYRYLHSPDMGNREWIERRGQWYVPRLIEDAATTQFVLFHSLAPQLSASQLESFHQEGRALSLTTEHTGSLQDLTFTDDDVLEAPLSEAEVLVEVKASGVNFRDIMVCLGQMPDENVGEIAGVVTKVGRDSRHEFSEGDRVYTWHVPRFASHVRCPASSVRRIPISVSFEQAASIPITYCTAYHCLVNVAQLRPGEKILIHSGAGGVGQAAIALAQHLGATVFTTVGSDEKKQVLIEQYGLSESRIFSSRSNSFIRRIHAVTGGRGVDVVINALAGSFLQKSLEVLAPLGRFVEIGKSDFLAHARMDMSAFARSISFSAVDLVQLAREKPQCMAEVFTGVHQMLVEQQIKPAYPLSAFPISHLEEVFRMMQKGQHVGKLVITHGPNDMVHVLPRSPPVARLRSNVTYLLVGGQGGLGRALSIWMAKCGARSIVSLSPSGARRPLTRGLIEELAQMGVQLFSRSCDIGDRSQLQVILADCAKHLPPIHGIIHAGLTLKNTTFENMTFEDFQQVLQPKVAGTYNLHEYFQGQPLDFFLMLSSYVGLLGSTGQANYAAASTFQDAFARWRTSLGKPTYSLDLGTMLGAGFFHEKPEALAHFERMGLGGIPLPALFALVGYAVSNPVSDYCDSQIAIGWAPPPTWTRADYAALDPLVSHLSPRLPPSSDDKESHEVSIDEAQDRQPLSTALSRCQTTEERASAITVALVKQIVNILGVATDDVDLGKPIAAHGGDSLVAIEFRNWFRKEIGHDFTTDQVSNLFSVQQLAAEAAG
ncbi:ketoacyl-synt-domain-containing protein [Aspergillus alliaceus]|uniref:Ketoacyl-synt-domain-containing protein n=1 Tax=Petromyces alliaceus TaxID=209559 RepID=A0A5N7BUB4_PETAA|nr:ketoacyl-synt-domain-containing protein [Aspergillus alliaceus]